MSTPGCPTLSTAPTAHYPVTAANKKPAGNPGRFKHRGDQRWAVEDLHPADAPSESVKMTLASHILHTQQGIRGLRHAKPFTTRWIQG